MAGRTTSMRSLIAAVVIFVAVVPVHVIAADAVPELRQPFPGNEPNEKTLRDRARAEALFAEEKYRRSLFIFEKDLAVLGDKYAQYMVGVHHQRGLGVPQNLSRAYAWHRLAAERGNPRLMELRDALAATLTADQRATGDELFGELQQRLGDRTLITRLIRDDVALLRASAGSRVGARGSPVTVVTRDGTTTIGATYYREIERRIETRMTYLAGRVEYGELESIRDELDEIDQLGGSQPAGEHDINRGAP